MLRKLLILLCLGAFIMVAMGAGCKKAAEEEEEGEKPPDDEEVEPE